MPPTGEYSWIKSEADKLRVYESGYYLDNPPMACRGHTLMVRLSGTRNRPPQKTLDKKQRIMW